MARLPDRHDFGRPVWNLTSRGCPTHPATNAAWGVANNMVRRSGGATLGFRTKSANPPTPNMWPRTATKKREILTARPFGAPLRDVAPEPPPGQANRAPLEPAPAPPKSEIAP